MHVQVLPQRHVPLGGGQVVQDHVDLLALPGGQHDTCLPKRGEQRLDQAFVAQLPMKLSPNAFCWDLPGAM
jgi:hypothetical protein